MNCHNHTRWLQGKENMTGWCMFPCKKTLMAISLLSLCLIACGALHHDSKDECTSQIPTKAQILRICACSMSCDLCYWSVWCSVWASHGLLQQVSVSPLCSLIYGIIWWMFCDLYACENVMCSIWWFTCVSVMKQCTHQSLLEQVVSTLECKTSGVDAKCNTTAIYIMPYSEYSGSL